MRKLPGNGTRIIRQAITTGNGDPASIASRHGWDSGTMVQGKALFVPLPDNVHWAPQTWPQDFATLEKLVTDLTSGEVKLTSWVRNMPPEKDVGSSNTKGEIRGKREHYPAPPDSTCAHPFLVVLVQGSVPFCYQITRGPIRGQVAKCDGLSIFPIEPTRIDASLCAPSCLHMGT